MLDINDWIKILESGHKFKVKIWCTGEISNALGIDFFNKIHDSDICSYIKSAKQGLHTCVKCRTAADKKAAAAGGYCGICIHGMYETVYPVMHNGERAATVYITNVKTNDDRAKARLKRSCERLGLSYERAQKLLKECETVSDSTMLQKTAEAAAFATQSIIEGNLKGTYEKHSQTVKELIAIAEDHENCQSLKTIAKEKYMNEKYLGRLFLSEVGCTFADHRNASRLTDAAKLLSHTKQKIIDIAIAVGYNNVEYFNRQFKKRFKLSPGEYRKRSLTDQTPKNPKMSS